MVGRIHQPDHCLTSLRVEPQFEFDSLVQRWVAQGPFEELAHNFGMYTLIPEDDGTDFVDPQEFL